MRADWDYVKVEIMASLLIQKFSNEYMYGMLQDTEEYIWSKAMIGGTHFGVSLRSRPKLLGSFFDANKGKLQ